MAKTISVREINPENWRRFKATAVMNEQTASIRLNNAITLMNALGAPREAALENAEFRIVPHRTDDSRDDAGAWAWKLETWVDDDRLEDALIL